jgi:hypothetical protein
MRTVAIGRWQLDRKLGLILFNRIPTHALATTAAASTTFALFGAVTSLAHEDKAALSADRVTATEVAVNATATALR